MSCWIAKAVRRNDLAFSLALTNVVFNEAVRILWHEWRKGMIPRGFPCGTDITCFGGLWRIPRIVRYDAEFDHYDSLVTLLHENLPLLCYCCDLIKDESLEIVREREES